MRWCMPAIPVLEVPKVRECYEYRANLGYTARSVSDKHRFPRPPPKCCSHRSGAGPGNLYFCHFWAAAVLCMGDVTGSTSFFLKGSATLLRGEAGGCRQSKHPAKVPVSLSLSLVIHRCSGKPVPVWPVPGSQVDHQPSGHAVPGNRQKFGERKNE